jgi:prepilin-type processing-associated H-X9-DG protein
LLAAAKYTQASTNELAWYVAERLGSSPPSERPTVARQLVCPAREGEAQGQLANGSRIDYALSDGRGLGDPPFGQLGSPDGRPLTLTAIAAITTPGNSAAMADADKGNVNPTLSGWNALPYQPVHGKTRNQLYFDWHVSSKTW